VATSSPRDYPSAVAIRRLHGSCSAAVFRRPLNGGLLPCLLGITPGCDWHWSDISGKGPHINLPLREPHSWVISGRVCLRGVHPSTVATRRACRVASSTDPPTRGDAGAVLTMAAAGTGLILSTHRARIVRLGIRQGWDFAVP